MRHERRGQSAGAGSTAHLSERRVRVAGREHKRRGEVRVRAEPVAHERRAVSVDALREALACVPQLNYAADRLALCNQLYCTCTFYTEKISHALGQVYENFQSIANKFSL